MPQTTSAEQSLWLQTADPTGYPPLSEDVDVEVAVIGGGIAGLTTALMLHRAGVGVAVVEAARIASGVTGCTTAKVTALQSTVYSSISNKHGKDAVAAYAEASLAGVEQLAAIVARERIECELERRPALTYAASPGEVQSVEKEAKLAIEAGLPVRMVDEVDLPYATHGAVRLDDQVQIHPVSYVRGLAGVLAAERVPIFENTRVTRMHAGSPCVLDTASGRVRAQQVVVATHYPVFDRGLYFARLSPRRSYCIAARLVSGAPPQGMSINAGSPTRSVRSSGDLLVLGGEGRAAGALDSTPERYATLERFAREHWDVAEVSYRWSAQDPVHYDNLPVIGPYFPGSSRVWVPSGFMKWGMSSATFAAMILSDAIQGRENPWAATFTPTRMSARSTPKVAKLGGKFSAEFVGDRLRRPRPRTAEEVQPGCGAIVGSRAARTGVYREEDGALHGVSVRCPHMGCLLRFNSAERSWDCPCHGSRFDVDGAVLEGPAVNPLEQRPVR